MEKRNSLRKYFTLILMFFTVVIGFSSWIIVGEKNVTLGESPVTKAVCYYTDSNGNKKEYTRIEKALEDANNTGTTTTVIVYSGYSYTIYKDCVIGTNVTLLIPFSDSCLEAPVYNSGETSVTNSTTTYGNRNGSGSGFADANSTAVGNNLKTEVKVGTEYQSVTITINSGGKLIIGGTVGTTAQRPTGQTSGNYAQITMLPKSRIIVNGEITCFGYIKENYSNNKSEVNCIGGTIIQPFVVYDYRGGANTSASYTNGVSPFSIFDMPNIQCVLTCENNGSIKGMADLYASSHHNFTTITLIGPSSAVINLNQNSKAIVKYHPTSYLYTVFAAQTKVSTEYTTIEVIGDAATGEMSMKAAGTPVSTNDVLFPVSSKLRINIREGNFIIQNKMKFFPGSILTVESTANLTISSEIIMYESFVENNDVANVHPSNLDHAKLIVNGTCTINSKYGGVIETQETGACLKLDNNFVNGMSSKEWQKAGNSADNYITQVVSSSAKGMVKVNSLPITENYFSKGEYISYGDYWVGSCTSYYQIKFLFTKQAKPDEDETFDVKISSSSGGTVLRTINISTSYAPPVLIEKGYYFNIKRTSNTDATLTQSNPSGSYTEGSWLQCNQNYEFSITLAQTSGGCVAAGTLVRMSDGSQKPVENIVPGDEVLTFNHETGKYSIKPVIFNSHSNLDWQYYNVINLKFNDGTLLRVINEHTMFDTSSNKYIVIKEDNYLDYIGHSFYGGSFDGINYLRKDLVLIDAYITNEYTGIYNPLSYYDMNCFTEGLLTMPGDISSVINIFEYDDDLKYNEVSMKQAVEEYGLYIYDDFKEYYSYEVYCSLPFQYLKILVGRGRITFEDIINLVDHHMIINGIDPRSKDYEKS